MQDELVELEEQLLERDKLPGENGSRRRDDDPVRKELMQKARLLLKDYSKSLFNVVYYTDGF
jgi:hypothetical protein